MANSLKFKITSLFLFFYFISFGSSLKDTLFSEKQLADSINSHLAQMFIQNYKNDKNGESYKNRYVLYYNYGKPVDLLSCTTPYIVVGPHEKPASVTNINAAIVESGILDSLCDFNNNVGGRNWAHIKHYAIYYGFPTSAGKTRLTETLASQSAIVPFMDQLGAKENFSSFSNASRDIENYIYATQKLPDEILNAEHRILTVQSLYSDAPMPDGKGIKRIAKTKTYFVKDDILTDQVFRNYISFCHDSTKFEKPGPYFEYKGEYYDDGGVLFQRIWGFIEFFENITNFNNDYNACTDIPATHTVAKAVRDCYCNQVNTIFNNSGNINPKNGLYNFVSALDRMIANSGTYGPYTPTMYSFINEFNCANPSTHFINTIFTDFLNSNTSHSFNEYILKERITKDGLPASSVSLYASLLWLTMSTIPDFEKMSPTERVRYMAYLKHQNPNGLGSLYINRPEGEGTVSMTQVMQEFISNIQSQQKAAEFFQILTENGLLVRWIYDKICNNWVVGDASEHKVIKAFNDIFIKSQGGIGKLAEKTASGDFNEKGVVWQPAVWWWNGTGNFNYREILGLPFVDDNGKVSFSARLITSSAPPLFGGMDINNYEFLDPFAVVPVIKGSTYSWLSDSNNGPGAICGGALDCPKVTYLPAISMVWYIDKLTESQQIAGMVTAVEIASMFIGIGEIRALMKVADVARAVKIRRAIAGFTLASTAGDLFLPTGVQIVGMEGLGWSATEAGKVKNQVQQVTSILALAGGGVQLADGIVGLAKFWSLRSKITGLAMNGDEFAKVYDDIAAYINLYPTSQNKVLSLLNIDDPAVRQVIDGITDPKLKLQLIGELADLPQDIKKSDKAAKVLSKLLGNVNDEADDIAKLYAELPPLKKQKFFENLESGAMHAAFEADRDLLYAWKILDDGLSPVGCKSIDKIEAANRLRKHNLFSNLGTATKAEASHVNKYTNLGDYLNIPMRGTEPLLQTPDLRLASNFESYQKIISAFSKWKNGTRHYTTNVWRGRGFSQTDYNLLFGPGSPEIIPLKGFQSCSKQISVAEHFAKWGNNVTYRVVFKIKPKAGIDIDDISDYGPTLKSLYHNGPDDILQFEVLLKEGKYKKISIIDHPNPPTQTPGEFWKIIELDELDIPIRTISE